MRYLFVVFFIFFSATGWCPGLDGEISVGAAAYNGDPNAESLLFQATQAGCWLNLSTIIPIAF